VREGVLYCHKYGQTKREKIPWWKREREREREREKEEKDASIT
jgi:hypothetical protein